MYKVDDQLLYHFEHSWVNVLGEDALIGVTDYIQSYVGQITEVSIGQVGEEIDGGIEYCRLDSADQDVSFITPISLVILEINQDILSSPSCLNTDCYTNWIIRVSIVDPDEIDDLIPPQEYSEFLTSLGVPPPEN